MKNNPHIQPGWSWFDSGLSFSMLSIIQPQKPAFSAPSLRSEAGQTSLEDSRHLMKFKAMLKGGSLFLLAAAVEEESCTLPSIIRVV